MQPTTCQYQVLMRSEFLAACKLFDGAGSQAVTSRVRCWIQISEYQDGKTNRQANCALYEQWFVRALTEDIGLMRL
jgi:hypothetical protein